MTGENFKFDSDNKKKPNVKEGKKSKMMYNTFYQFGKGEIYLPKNANETLRVKRRLQKNYQVDNEELARSFGDVCIYRGWLAHSFADGGNVFYRFQLNIDRN